MSVRPEMERSAPAWRPHTPAALVDALQTALAAGAPVEVVGGGSKRALGRPVQAARRLDVSALRGIVSYEPEELVLTAQAATPLAEVEAALLRRRQCLAFEPPDLGPLLGANAGLATLGGIVATGLSGPRRPKAGAARDHVLGFAAVSGRGEAFAGGGRVVKNVTGYDMPKLLTGSHGTLAVMTQISMRVLPAPADECTLCCLGLDAARAVSLLTAALQSAADVSGACHLPAGLAPPDAGPESVTALRLEGVAPSIEYRLAQLRGALAQAGAQRVLGRDASQTLWRWVRDVGPFVAQAPRCVWRLSVPPAAGAQVLDRIQRAIPGATAFLDWGGGLLWLMLPDGEEEAAERVRAALAPGGGHATLVRASAAVRASVEVFQPQPAALAQLTARIKAQFDPGRVLNPGRMYAHG